MRQSPALISGCEAEGLRDLALEDIVLLQSFSVGVYHPCIPPPAKPTRLQYYFTPVAQYTPPHRPPVFMPYTIHYWSKYQQVIRTRTRQQNKPLTQRQSEQRRNDA